MKYFFDTYALFEIIRENRSYLKYSDEEIVTSILNLGELYFSLLKNEGKAAAEHWFGRFRNCTVPLNADIIKAAMDFKFQNRGKSFSFVDCAGYAAAKGHNLVFLTGDAGFEKVKNAEYVK